MLTGGAENGYYQNSGSPYDCHNGAFDVVQELPLVRGMTWELFERVAPHVTVYGTGKVNLNTAGYDVLRCLGHYVGASETDAAGFAGSIERLRARGVVFADYGDSAVAEGLSERDAALYESLLQSRSVVAFDSSCFGGTAWGKASGRVTADRGVDFAFDRETGEKLYWHE